MAGRPPLRIGQHGKITRRHLGGGVWVVTCRVRDLDGVTRSVQRKTPTGVADEYGARAEAELLNAIAGRRPPGTGSISGTTTLGPLLDRYIQRCREDGELAPKSVDTYEATITAVQPRMADIRVSEATPGLLDEILRGIRRDHGETRERHTKVALNSVLTDAVLAGAITANPVRELKRRRVRHGGGPKGAPAIDVKQVRSLLATITSSEACRAKDLADPVTLLAATGVETRRAAGTALGGRRP